MTALAGLEDLAAAAYQSRGVRSGALACWGNARLFPPSIRARAGQDREPLMFDLDPVTRVGVGDRHACALHADERVSCWGSNAGGALGRGSTDDTADADPGPVLGLPAIADLVVGATMSCGMSHDRDVHCWGRWPATDGAPYRESGTPVKLRLEPSADGPAHSEPLARRWSADLRSARHRRVS